MYKVQGFAGNPGLLASGCCVKKGMGFGGVVHGASCCGGVEVRAGDGGLDQGLGSGDGEIGRSQGVSRMEPGGGLGVHHGLKPAAAVPPASSRPPPAQEKVPVVAQRGRLDENVERGGVQQAVRYMEQTTRFPFYSLP